MTGPAAGRFLRTGCVSSQSGSVSLTVQSLLSFPKTLSRVEVSIFLASVDSVSASPPSPRGSLCKIPVGRNIHHMVPCQPSAEMCSTFHHKPAVTQPPCLPGVACSAAWWVQTYGAGQLEYFKVGTWAVCDHQQTWHFFSKIHRFQGQTGPL